MAIRNVLYMAALSASRYNPALRAFSNRLADANEKSHARRKVRVAPARARAGKARDARPFDHSSMSQTASLA